MLPARLRKNKFPGRKGLRQKNVAPRRAHVPAAVLPNGRPMQARGVVGGVQHHELPPAQWPRLARRPGDSLADKRQGVIHCVTAHRCMASRIGGRGPGVPRTMVAPTPVPGRRCPPRLHGGNTEQGDPDRCRSHRTSVQPGHAPIYDVGYRHGGASTTCNISPSIRTPVWMKTPYGLPGGYGGCSRKRSKSHASVLRAHIDHHNAQTRPHERRARLGPLYKPKGAPPSASSNSMCEVLKGPGETWRSQLDAYYRSQPIFALLGGIGRETRHPTRIL